MISEVFQTLGIALGLGLLVGLQRERSHSRWAGIRTFPLNTLLDTICGLLATNLGGWIVAAGFLAVVGIVVMANVAELMDVRLALGQLDDDAGRTQTNPHPDGQPVREQSLDTDRSPRGRVLTQSVPAQRQHPAVGGR